MPTDSSFSRQIMSEPKIASCITTQCGLSENALIAIYQEIGLYLRAGDDKRDRLVDIYFTVLIGSISAIILLLSIKPSTGSRLYEAALCLGGLLIITTEVITWALIASRKWHAEYVNCSIIIQTMLRIRAQRLSGDIVSSSQHHPFSPGFFTSRTFVLVQMGMIALCLVMSAILIEINSGSVWYYAVGTMAGLLLISLNLIVSHIILNRAERIFWQNPKTSWCLSGL